MSLRILLVDDNALVRRSLRDCIEAHTDWKICGEADNGEVAIQRVQELRPDIVILDLQMPVMDGFVAARHIRLMAPNTGIVMVTLHSCEQVIRDAAQIGVEHVISKYDWKPEELIASIRKVGPQRSDRPSNPPLPLTF